MPHLDQLLQSIVSTAADYRNSEIPAFTTQHVSQWVSQFPHQTHVPILAEIDHVLKRTYFSREYVERFFSALISYERMVGGDAPTFWRNMNFLNVQTVGNSQSDLLDIFGRRLEEALGFGLADCGKSPDSYMYVDDALFSGGRIKYDLTRWIENSAPANATVFVVTIARHTQGHFFLEKDLVKAMRQAGKNIAIRWVSRYVIEDRNAYINVSDVLRPTAVPVDPLSQAYLATLGAQPGLRVPGNVGGNGFFSSEAGRSLLEQEFFKMGAYIRQICPNLGVYQRPLGNTTHKKMGFGSTIVTFRNCPNNAPLVFWVGHPWYPLFPRETNYI